MYIEILKSERSPHEKNGAFLPLSMSCHRFSCRNLFFVGCRRSTWGGGMIAHQHLTLHWKIFRGEIKLYTAYPLICWALRIAVRMLAPVPGKNAIFHPSPHLVHVEYPSCPPPPLPPSPPCNNQDFPFRDCCPRSPYVKATVS